MRGRENKKTYVRKQKQVAIILAAALTVSGVQGNGLWAIKVMAAQNENQEQTSDSARETVKIHTAEELAEFSRKCASEKGASCTGQHTRAGCR